MSSPFVFPILIQPIVGHCVIWIASVSETAASVRRLKTDWTVQHVITLQSCSLERAEYYQRYLKDQPVNKLNKALEVIEQARKEYR